MSIVLSLLALSYFYLARGAYYVGVTDPANWHDAKAHCEAGVWAKIPVKLTGGALANWHSYDEYKEYVRAAYHHSGGDAWVGLSDSGGNEGQWTMKYGNTEYTCGGNCNGLDAWSINQPDNHMGNQDCAAVWHHPTKRGDANGLDDANCGDFKRYICKFPNSESLAMSGSLSANAAPIPPEIPFEEPGNDYFVFEFTSMMGMVTFVSIILNVMAITAFTLICCSFRRKSLGYSKVKKYAAEDEKL